MPAQPARTSARAPRVLAGMAAAVVGLTVVAIIVLLICRVAGVPQADFTSGPLFFLAVLPLPGLAIGLLLVIALIVVSGISRARAQTPKR